MGQMSMGQTCGLGWLLLLAIVASGCAPQRSVRVEPLDRPPPPAGERDTRPAPGSLSRSGEYVVARGDTLYGIAFRHGQDYRDVARRNRIEPPYTIYPGQTLQLGERVAASTAARTRRPAGATTRSTGAGLIAGTAGSGASSTPARSAPAATVPAPTPAQGAASASSSAGLPSGTTPAAPVVAATPAVTPGTPATLAALPTGPVRWRWPANGQMVSTFLTGDPTRQGIGIAGNNGQPVHAAGDGVVVYSGAGLIGYGELVIIKHSDEWLSAYGHNRKRLVAEGQAVRGGEQIAEMGRSGASRDMLHFEIRRNGKPVDPLRLLPKQ
jgi:lipoprotein NlpD